MLLSQSPAPGARFLRHSGDAFSFELRVEGAPAGGRAVLRTSLGGARRRRRETVASFDEDRPPLALDWNDVPMRLARREDGGAEVWEVRLPLVDIGFFRAKACWFAPGSTRPLWPDGGDVQIKVSPAWTVQGASIYCAFPRQFGPACGAERSDAAPPEALALDGRGWAAIPPEGTFRALARRLDTIVLEEGFRVVQLLPVHPVPTTYARMGRFGSPFASTDFLAVNPALAEFDPAATPLDQFRELVDAVHVRGARLFIDLPANHTGWASTLQTHHPEWFRREPDGRFRSPGAWGVTWEDLVEIDHARPGVRQFVASVFEFWCAQGVDGFRCDAGYMVPAETWRYVVARVREQFPDTVFLLEGLGGKISVTRDLISEQGLDWAYSELFQTDDRAAFERYLPGATAMGEETGPLAHYAETHDNNRLAARSRSWARLRTALAALASQQGCFGITNGVEWFAAEKVDVHGASALRWGAPDNQVAAIRRLNALLSLHPAFGAGARVEMVQRGDGNSLALLRRSKAGSRKSKAGERGSRGESSTRDPRTCGPGDLLVLANLDPDNPQPVSWSGFDAAGAVVLFDSTTGTGAPGDTLRPSGSEATARLTPGQVVCLSRDSADLAALDAALAAPPSREPPAAVRRQELRMAALRLRRVLTGGRPLDPDEDVDALADALAADPLAAVARFLPPGAMPPVTTCRFPEDERRVVPLPAGNFLLVRAAAPFRAHLEYAAGGRALRKSAGSFALADGSHAAFVDHPATDADEPLPATLRLELSAPERPLRGAVALQVLPARCRAPRLGKSGAEVRRGDFAALLVNGRGAMARVRARFGEVRSQYDALLAANPDPAVPCDRVVLLPRVRAWVVHQGFSTPLDSACLRAFRAAPDAVTWTFDAPVGTGRTVALSAELRLAPGENRATLAFARRSGGGDPARADDGETVELILRPDVESRSFHEKTKAFAGPERDFPPAVSPRADGFLFAPPGRVPLAVRLGGGRFVPEPEWHYMVAHPEEASRGQDGSGDCFSPGWFSATLAGGDSVALEAAVPEDGSQVRKSESPKVRKFNLRTGEPANAAEGGFDAALSAASRAFLAVREDAPTVIAGFPWFLDWGRDTFIALRGLLADGLVDVALAVLRKFGAFEDRGTLPNMIHGADASNRDTSDAPLWFCVVAGEVGGGKPPADLAKVVLRILRGYLAGTPNGIRVDPASALVFSPPHFTWMDTNWPAGTPREGYPVEIQALWIAALDLAASLEPKGPWRGLRDAARESLLRFFWSPERGFLSDCLHAPGGFRPAADAVADDHLRCNQLFAVTLGAIGADHPAARAVVASSERLLVPGAIRTLAPGRTDFALPIRGADGALLNDPHAPYWGRYEGDEDTRRKPAYHNGTAWPWPFPSYAEALVKVHGASAAAAARSLLASALPLLESGCIGHLPEIADGDAPHAGRGCDAQAWSATEFLRVSRLLGGPAR
ncbi:MAG: glycogen debranching enzyme N-terminal domain-containing protein [Kiritimatiellae bacterium]|nr:glycogen debranching enzyme N-terminal domain-containing protein [Kiritimatiellia bacterium]